jgi:hypothetical protein
VAYGDKILSPEKYRADRLKKGYSKGSMHAIVLDLWIICVYRKHKKGGLAFSAIARGLAMFDLDPCFWTAPLQHFILAT